VKILYVSQYFPPEMGAPAARAAELSRHWANSGHEVSVLTGFPNHPTGVVPPEWRERLRDLTWHEQGDGVNVFRTWLWPLPNRKAHERMRNYASFFLSAAVRGLSLTRPDVIIGTSPQLLVGLAGWWLAFVHRVPFVFEVRDLWPESLTAVGAGREGSALHRVLSAIAGFLYRQSDHIVVVTAAFKQHLVRYWQVPAEKISVVENGVESDLFAPSPAAEILLLRQYLAIGQDTFLVGYVGTMGMAHGLETLLEAASRLRQTDPRVLFLLIGEGAEKDRIKALALDQGLTNVRFLDQQPRENIPAFISVCAACLVLLKKTDVFKTVIPTKMLEFMSCGCPVILGVDGQAREIIDEAGAGIGIEPENPEALMDAVQRLAGDPILRRKLGNSGREYIVRRFSRRRTAEDYIGVLEKVVRIKLAKPVRSR
jgi:glycosyltransferase involved in cell wall biosynthesis